MDLSEQVFCPGMAYMALSRVKQLENLRLIAFKEEAIKVSAKCLRQVQSCVCGSTTADLWKYRP